MEAESKPLLLAQPGIPPSRFGTVRAIQDTAPTRSARIARETLAISIWLIVLVKLCVYDIDTYFAQRFLPNEAWLLNYRFFALLCLAALLAFIFRPFTIFVWLMYVFLYPFIALFWKVPRGLYKKGNWVLVFAALSGAVSFFRSIKYILLVSAVALTAMSIVIETTNQYLLWGSVVALVTMLLLAYVRRFISVFRLNFLFQIYTAGIVKNRDARMASYRLKEDLRDLPLANLSDDQRKIWIASLEQPVLANRFCLFIAKKLKEYQQSGMHFIFGVLAVLAMVVASTLTFAFVNLALFKIDPANFDTSGSPSFFTFTYYSFNSFVFSSVKEMVPTGTASQVMSMIEKFLALFLIGIFAAYMISIRSQRSTEQLNAVIAGLEEDSRLTEGVIREEYRIENVDAALSELERLKAGTMMLLDYLTRNLK